MLLSNTAQLGELNHTKTCTNASLLNLMNLHLYTMKSTKVQTLGANIWPGAKELLRVREALRKRMRSRTCNGKYTEDYKSIRLKD